ncbi:hypothetical protein D9C01_13885, partial [Corynebacterium diphtheriae]
LFRGSIVNYRADSFADMIRPLTETLTVATPLIIGRLGRLPGPVPRLDRELPGGLVRGHDPPPHRDPHGGHAADH